MFCHETERLAVNFIVIENVKDNLKLNSLHWKFNVQDLEGFDELLNNFL